MRRKSVITRRIPPKQKPLVRMNKSKGASFENKMFKYFTQYLQSRDINGLVFKFPEGKHINQWMDILIDSQDFGYIGVECKSIDDSKLVNSKVYTKLLSRKNEDYGHQLRKQHFFLQSTGRYGIIAIEFSASGIIVLVPHEYIYSLIENGVVSVTIEDLLKIGFNIEDKKASLKLYIHKYCKTNSLM